MKKGICLIWIAVFVIACRQENSYTYTKDIAPILLKNCTPCHQPDGAAPFSLINFNQVNRKKKTILEVTQSGLMPPWPADRNYTHFVGEKYLSENDKLTIKKWIEGGAPEEILLTSLKIRTSQSKALLESPIQRSGLIAFTLKGIVEIIFTSRHYPLNFQKKNMSELWNFYQGKTILFTT